MSFLVFRSAAFSTSREATKTVSLYTSTLNYLEAQHQNKPRRAPVLKLCRTFKATPLSAAGQLERKMGKSSCSRRKQSSQSLPSSSGQRPSVTGWHRSLFVGEDHTVVIVVTVVDHTGVIVACHKAATRPESNALQENTKNAKTQRWRKM